MSINDNLPALPAPDANARGTLSSEELAEILARARKETAHSVVTVGEEARRREEHEAEERTLAEAWWVEQRDVRAIDADTEAQRGEATSRMVRGGAMVGGGVLAGFALAGPPGAVVGGALLWIADHFIGQRPLGR